MHKAGANPSATERLSRLLAQAAIAFPLLLGLCSLALSPESPSVSAQEVATLTLTATLDDTATESPTPTTDSVVVTDTPLAPAEPLVSPTETDPIPAPTETPSPILTLVPSETSTLELTPTITTTPAITAGSIDSAAKFVADEVLVKFRSGYTAETAETLIESSLAGVSVEESEEELATSFGIYVLKVPAGQVPQIVAALLNNPAVEFAEPNYLAQAYFRPNDPDFSRQPYLWNIQAPQAWDVTTGSPGVVVAVIDTGMDTTHPDLAAKIWNNLGEIGTDASGNDKRNNSIDDDGNDYVDDWQGWNTVANSNTVADDHGHGTHVAGIIAADTNNLAGIAGVAPDALLMPVKALDAAGFGTYAQVAEGILYATNRGARIINLSLGSPSSSRLLRAAIDYADAHGVTVVAATGDSGTFETNYPANYPNVLGVGATDASNQLAAFSTYGDAVNLVAPGLDVYSTYPGGGYAQFSGTSMAAAHVSGVAALLASQPQFDSPDKIRAALQSSAADLGDAGWDMYYGFGLVQAFNALNYLSGETPAPTPTLAPTLPVVNTPSPTPTDYLNGGVETLAVNDLWAQTSMTRSNCTATNEANAYSPPSFDDVSGYCQFTAAGNWTYNNIQNTTLTAVYSATLTIRFYAANWVNDQILVEVSNNGTSWNTVATFQTGSAPPTALSYYSYDVSTWIGAPAQANNAQVRFRVVAVAPGLDANLRIYSDQMRLTVSDVLPAVATPTAPAPVPTNVPGASDPHVYYSAMTGSCAACHRSHTASGIVLRQAWPEENVCFSCHTSGGTGTNVQPAFTSYTNTATRFFKHDIALTNGVHRVGQNTGASFGGANRHIECEDCHDPHEATRGSASAPFLQRVLNYIGGVNPNWTAAGAPASYTWMPQAEREYQVCFKCHSSFTTLPTYQPDGWSGAAYVANGLPKLTSSNASQVLDSRDLAREFNPYNASFHPVAARGRNTTIAAGAFVAGWSANSIVYCADCHTNATPATGGNGPHGSPRLHLLYGANDYTTRDRGGSNHPPGSGEVCFKCHLYAVYANGNNNNASLTRFRSGADNFHDFHVWGRGSDTISCYSCHDTHGSEQQHLINFDTSVVVPDAGYNSQTAWVWNGTTGTCYLSCHGVNHGTGKQYSP